MGSAGIYTQEIDLSLYASNETDTFFGVVGHFSKGPLDQEEPTLITSYPELLATFGQPRSDGDSQAWYACREYLRRGNKLKVVRVESTANPAAAAVSSLRGYEEGSALESGADGDCSGAAGTFASTTATFQTNKVQPGDILKITSGADAGFYEIDTVPGETSVTVKNVSAWPGGATGLNYEVVTGLRQELADGATSIPALREFTSATGRFTAGTDNCNVQPDDLLVIEDSGDPEDNGIYVIETVSNATTLVVNRDFPVGSKSGLSYKIFSHIAAQDIGATSAPTTRTLTCAGHDFATSHGVVVGDWLYINDAGDTGDNGWYYITNVAATVLTVNRDWPEGNNTGLTFQVFPHSVKLAGYYKGTYGDNMEVFVTASAGEPGSKVDIEVRESGVQVEKWFEVGYMTAATDLADSEYVVPTVTANRGGIPADADVDFAGGDDGESGIVDADYIGGVGEGLQLFASAESERVDVLAIPGEYSQAIGDALIALAENRRNCIVLLDPPPWATVDTAQEVVQWSNGTGSLGRTTPLSTSYGACYWPWVKVYDEYHGAYRWTAPSGHIAAVFAYNDRIAYPWFAPAGGNRGKLIGSSGLRITPDQGQRDYMQSGTNVVNPLVVYSDEGTMVYGQKTCLRSTTALNRLNVRRMVMWVANSAASALRNIIFDPNDESSWKLVYDVVNPLTRFVKKNRGLEDYLIVCDETNNTAITKANYQLICDIYLKPILAAEEIHLRFIITSQDANFQELTGS